MGKPRQMFEVQKNASLKVQQCRLYEGEARNQLVSFGVFAFF